MKSVSFLRSWRRRDSKPSKSPINDDHHLPLQYPVQLEESSVALSPTSARPAGSSSPARAPHMSLVSLPFRESYGNTGEDTLQHRGSAQSTSANYDPSPYKDDSSRMIYHPTQSLMGLNSAVSNHVHGPPRNAKHGTPSILQSQLSAINSSSTDLNPLSSHHSSSQWSHNSRPTDATAIKTRSPTRVKFDTSVQILDASPQHSKISFTRASSTIDTHLGGCQDTGRTHSDLPQEGGRPFHRRDSALPRNEHNHSPTIIGRTGPDISTSENRTHRGLASTRSTPHLRTTVEYPFNNPLPPLPNESPRPTVDNITSLFPVPPPLNIRKKRPHPLVLQPQPSRPLRPSPSPNSSSTDSTFVVTPHSSSGSHFPTPLPTPLKSPLGRKGTPIPPMLHNPPTSPLPSPPNVPPSSAPNCHLPGPMTQSSQSLGRLKPCRSASNMRADRFLSSLPTHRMTSSDPIAEVSGKPTKDRTSPLKHDPNSNNVGNSSRPIDRREERVPSPQEGSVQWGYAL